MASKDNIFPAAVGKILPSVPHWKATLVGTWRPIERVTLTAAARYASRNYGSLDNSDIVGNTYQGFYEYDDLLRVVSRHYADRVGHFILADGYLVRLEGRLRKT